MIKYLEKEGDFADLTKKKIIVDFYADWCGPCRILARNMEAIEKEIEVLKVNADEYSELASKYQIEAIPALFLFENQEVVKRHVGLMDSQDILNFYND